MRFKMIRPIVFSALIGLLALVPAPALARSAQGTAASTEPAGSATQAMVGVLQDMSTVMHRWMSEMSAPNGPSSKDAQRMASAMRKMSGMMKDMSSMMQQTVPPESGSNDLMGNNGVENGGSNGMMNGNGNGMMNGNGNGMMGGNGMMNGNDNGMMNGGGNGAGAMMNSQMMERMQQMREQMQKLIANEEG